MSTNRPIPVHPELTAIAVAAPVPGMIADELLTDVKVNSEQFKYNEYPVDQGIRVQNTEVGRTGQVQRVEFGGVEKDGSTKDQGLESPVPRTDQTANTTAANPLDLASEMTSQLVTIGREFRVRNLFFSSASYLPAQITTYDADEGWYDPDSDPLGDIEAAIDAMLVKPNTLTLGKDGWRALRSHPKVVKQARPANVSGEGRLSKDEIRDLFEIEKIVVGEAMGTFSNPGQDPVLQRLWDAHASLTFIERVVKSEKTFTFASSFRLTGKETRVYFDEKVGVHGADVVRVSERLVEKVIAQRAGWLFQNAAKAPA